MSAILFLAGGAAVGVVNALHGPGWRLALALDAGVLLVNLALVAVIASALGFDRASVRTLAGDLWPFGGDRSDEGRDG